MLRRIALVVLLAAVVGAARAPGIGAETNLPFTAAPVHLGVSSCGGSSCHGAVEPWPGSTVLQNEFITWQTKDRHARAYKTLLSEKSKRIAANLGLTNAYEAKICLDCHADNVPAEQRAKGFQISDGVGCEACHGGAVGWLGVHVSGKSDHGVYPKDRLQFRYRNLRPSIHCLQS